MSKSPNWGQGTQLEKLGFHHAEIQEIIDNHRAVHELLASIREKKRRSTFQRIMYATGIIDPTGFLNKALTHKELLIGFPSVNGRIIDLLLKIEINVSLHILNLNIVLPNKESDDEVQSAIKKMNWTSIKSKKLGSLEAMEENIDSTHKECRRTNIWAAISMAILHPESFRQGEILVFSQFRYKSASPLHNLVVPILRLKRGQIYIDAADYCDPIREGNFHSLRLYG
ncbi:hypothetical protein KKA15_00670 [Patescibacteria group bacterium]|nr:hypothetical protein [Patescibacteria group bacterium]